MYVAAQRIDGVPCGDERRLARDGRKLVGSVLVDPPRLAARTALAGVEKRVLVVRGVKSLEARCSAAAVVIPRERARLRRA